MENVVPEADWLLTLKRSPAAKLVLEGATSSNAALRRKASWAKAPCVITHGLPAVVVAARRAQVEGVVPVFVTRIVAVDTAAEDIDKEPKPYVLGSPFWLAMSTPST